MEEKIDTLSDSFERIVEIFVKMAESFDQKVAGLNLKMTMLLENIQKIYNEMYSKNEYKASTREQSVVVPPPANPPKTVQKTQTRPSNASNRRELINELETLFNKRKMNKSD
ncbi:MAG: hypothetical protein ACFFAO_16970 [Candidatus Hermodarchaeota archaeon]